MSDRLQIAPNASKRHPEVVKAVRHAQKSLAAGDVAGGMVHLQAADAACKANVAECRVRIANGVGTKRQRKVDVAVANELIKVRDALEKVAQEATSPSPKASAPRAFPKKPTTTSAPPSPRRSAQPPRRVAHTPEIPPMQQFLPPTGNPAGYSRAGGLVQAPPGAGMYQRVPFQTSAAAAGVANVNTAAADAFLSFGAVAGAANMTMTTPQLPWLTYRLRGLVIDHLSDAAGVSDTITVSDLREQGGPNLVIGEGRIGVQSFRMGDRHLVGLRYNPIVQAPNFLEITIQANGFGQVAAPAGNHVIFASAIIETIEDSTYGKINALTTRLNQGHFGGGQGKGYVFMSGAPVSGTVQRVPLRVQTENFNAGAALNAVNASSFRLGNATTSIVLQSEQISWAELQIVGIEFGTPIKTVATDSVFFQDLQVGGGASLFSQAGNIPAINFLGDESGRGGGAHSMCGLRAYPLLSATNQASLTLSGNALAAAGVVAGTVDIPYVNILVDRLTDDVFGVQPTSAQSPYSKASGLASSGNYTARKLLR